MIKSLIQIFLSIICFHIRHVQESRKEHKQKQQNRQKTQLDTWQADVQSQLLLPQDFTPELIAQLAAEGYDITSGASRKARSRQQSTLANSVNAIEDSSDEDDDKPSDEFREAHFSKPKQSATSSQVNSSGSRLSKVAVKYDGEDPNDNPSFKRFSQILGERRVWLTVTQINLCLLRLHYMS